MAFSVSSDGHLGFFCITATRGLPNLCAVVFENVISIPNTTQSFKKLSQSAQFLQILTYSLPANSKKRKGSPYSITERRVPELIPVLGSQPAGDVSHTPAGRLPLHSARPAVTFATLKRAATNFGAW